jgi:hypothetical protein
MATIIDIDVLLDVIGAAFLAGVGITAIFGLVIYGGTRFADMRRAGNAVGAVLFASFAALGLIAFGASVVIGIIVMSSKS